MNGLTRDVTAEPASRDRIISVNGDREKKLYPAQLTKSRIGNHNLLIHTLLEVLTVHTYIRTHNYINKCVVAMLWSEMGRNGG